MKAWRTYATTTDERADHLVDPAYRAFFFNTLPPGTEFTRNLPVEGARLVGSSSAMLKLVVLGKPTWVAMKRASHGWTLTLDEDEILEELTRGWKQQRFGKILYVTRKPLTPRQVSVAAAFAKTAEKVAQDLRTPLPEITYYVAMDAKDAVEVVGEGMENGGRGRHRAIKAYLKLDHVHELVHVLAMETGLVNPFIDEGLASTFEPGHRFLGQRECWSTRRRLGSHYLRLLDGGYFYKAKQEKLNVYGVAQATLRLWLKAAGPEKILAVLREASENPWEIRQILERQLGPLPEQEKAIHAELAKVCRGL